MASPEAIMMEGLLQREWFKPKMSRQEAEDQLKNREVGSFYVRPSTKADHYALSYKTRDGSISHSLIHITAKGYKVPEEHKVYSTLSDLLKACRFLRWVEPVSDAALAILIEAFPDLPQEIIVETLQQTRNNVETALDTLLKKQEHNEIFVSKKELENIVAPNKSSPPKQKKSHRKSSKPADPAPIVTGMENLAVSPPVSAKATTPSIPSSPTTVLPKFMAFSNNEFTQKDAFDNWINLPQKMSTVNQIPQSLETNLQKILRNPAHPMGKKIDTFVINFNASYQGTISNKDLESKFQAAVQDVQQFFATLSSNIVGKVPEFNTPAGFIAVWRSSQTVIFPGIYLSLFQLFQRKFFDSDRAKAQAIQSVKHLLPQTFGTKHPGVQYSGISILQELSNFHGAHDKIATLTRVLQSIHKDVADHFKRTGARSDPLNADELVNTLSYVIVQSSLNSPFSELMFMKTFISDRIKSSLDGFGLCVLETALENIEALAKQTVRPQTNQFDLLTDSHTNFAQPTFAQWPAPQQQPMYNMNQLPNQNAHPSQNTFPNQYPNQNAFPPQNFPPQGYPPQVYPHQSYNPGFTDVISYELPPFNPNANHDVPTFQPDQAPANGTESPAQQASAPPPAFDTLKRVEKSYIQNLKTTANTVDSHNQLAAYYSSKENYLKAIYHSKQALEIDPTNEIAMTNLIVFTKNLSNATAHAKYG